MRKWNIPTIHWTFCQVSVVFGSVVIFFLCVFLAQSIPFRTVSGTFISTYQKILKYSRYPLAGIAFFFPSLKCTTPNSLVSEFYIKSSYCVRSTCLYEGRLDILSIFYWSRECLSSGLKSLCVNCQVLTYLLLVIRDSPMIVIGLAWIVKIAICFLLVQHFNYTWFTLATQA